MRIRRFAAAAIAVCIAMMLIGALPALAFTDEGDEGIDNTNDDGSGEEGTEVTDETAEPSVSDNDSGIVPAQEAEAPVDEETDAPWTERFLAPTVLALGSLAIVGVVAYYYVRLRGRYQVVD